ncbi:hypothetical protein H6503_00840 [Candidatus Woesearchaeota archaeon]|nr:hypothetical protein [Candidatus Woesearchaeota archaeon]
MKKVILAILVLILIAGCNKEPEKVELTRYDFGLLSLKWDSGIYTCESTPLDTFTINVKMDPSVDKIKTLEETTNCVIVIDDIVKQDLSEGFIAFKKGYMTLKSIENLQIIDQTLDRRKSHEVGLCCSMDMMNSLKRKDYICSIGTLMEVC